ncbi:hypothetical protein HELRODRAFT_173613 [Helobdella robusta]|uniref:Uncharacterized protein n=1 Tax=Helobdella robusta TaxID=6412 RepID=T1F719_HELRO|nr:hypothetical protein HELRODRAFT_173613 [Helobdella robusta]ESO03327.1 hypothetical protein HELRODRAFT_173613 [Helobdella robusta]
MVIAILRIAAIVPEYPAIPHCKYELMKMSILDNPFNTEYFAWLDVGLFRDLTDYPFYYSILGINHFFLRNFSINLLEDFKDSEVGYTEVYELQRNVDACDVIEQNIVWVCGAYFVEHSKVLLKWIGEYMNGVEMMIRKHDCTGTDQQVINWLFSNKKKLNITTNIQTYTNAGGRGWSVKHYGPKSAWLQETRKSTLSLSFKKWLRFGFRSDFKPNLRF